MALDKAIVARIATLARIRIGEDQLEPLTAELSGILDWVEQLMAVDTENVPPMTSVAEMTLPMRDDVVTDGANRDAALRNAPRSARGFYTVPKVVE
jgi:aspartyl-tRNA(Asn)/glutamyl-tRNA(Gln) amidotransferase subunit C